MDENYRLHFCALLIGCYDLERLANTAIRREKHNANAIQAAIAKGAQAVVDGKLDQRQAGILGYYLQLALSNVKRVDFKEGWEQEI